MSHLAFSAHTAAYAASIVAWFDERSEPFRGFGEGRHRCDAVGR